MSEELLDERFQAMLRHAGQSLRAIPLGFLAPVSHLSMVDSPVLSQRANTG